MSKAERQKRIQERLRKPDLKPFQTEADKQVENSRMARRKGEAWRKLIAVGLLKDSLKSSVGYSIDDPEEVKMENLDSVIGGRLLA